MFYDRLTFLCFVEDRDLYFSIGDQMYLEFTTLHLYKKRSSVRLTRPSTVEGRNIFVPCDIDVGRVNLTMPYE